MSADDREKWDKTVKSFLNWDVYYLQEYAASLQIHGGGTPLLIAYSDAESSFCYVVFKKDIADAPEFQGQLVHGRYFDLETPYGYGGPLSDAPIPVSSQKRFMDCFSSFAKEQSIVSQFIRFHPLLMNHLETQALFETRYLHDTIYIDTRSPDLIMQNMDPKSRNMIRKAERSGITIVQKEIGEYESFLPIYVETMNQKGADEYYYFGENYLRSLSALKENACFFYALKDEQPVAAAIMYYNDRFMHYHLAGTRAEYRQYAPNNLLLYEAACWASQRGITAFHLGGGLTQDDSLFGFKKQFNKKGRLPFVIGRTVLDSEAYQSLLDIRKALDKSFDPDNRRMIQYRA